MKHRKTAYMLNKSNILLSKYNEAVAMDLLDMKIVYSEDETDNDANLAHREVGEESDEESDEETEVNEPSRFVVKRKAFRKLEQFQCVNEFFEILDTLPTKKNGKKTKKQKCIRRIRYAKENHVNENNSNSERDNDSDVDIDIPEALRELKLLKD